MTIHRVYVTTDAPHPVRQFLADAWALLKLLGHAVGWLLLAPLDLLFALLGFPPATYTLHLIADQARVDAAHPAPVEPEELSGTVLPKETCS